jgi:hypothetical protein
MNYIRYDNFVEFFLVMNLLGSLVEKGLTDERVWSIQRIL